MKKEHQFVAKIAGISFLSSFLTCLGMDVVRMYNDEIENLKMHNKELVMEIDDTLAKGSASFKRGILSNEKIKKELNWYPKYDVKEGFRRTIEYLKDVK